MNLLHKAINELIDSPGGPYMQDIFDKMILMEIDRRKKIGRKRRQGASLSSSSEAERDAPSAEPTMKEVLE